MTDYDLVLDVLIRWGIREKGWRYMSMLDFLTIYLNLFLTISSAWY